MRTTLDLENGTRIEEIVDVNVYEKRKANSDNFKGNVRARTDERNQADPAFFRPPVEHVPNLINIPDEEMTDEVPFRRRQTQPSQANSIPTAAPASTPEPK
jgi:hypothetical protein